MESYSVLDDGSETTILLHVAAHDLGFEGQPEDLHLRTVRQDLQVLHGAGVSFTLSPASQPCRVYQIKRAFMAKELGLAKHASSQCPAEEVPPLSRASSTTLTHNPNPNPSASSAYRFGQPASYNPNGTCPTWSPWQASYHKDQVRMDI